MYGYVLNNPLKFIDPTGTTCVYNDNDPEHQNPVGDDGDGQGCAGVGVAPGNPNNFESTLNPNNYVNQTVNEQQGSWINYFFESTLGGVGLNAWGQPDVFNPDLKDTPILVYVRPGSPVPKVSKHKPTVADFAACTFAPHDFIATAYGGRPSPADALVGNNNEVPAGPIDVNKRGTTVPRGDTHYVGPGGQFTAQSATLAASVVSNTISDCRAVLGR